MEETLNVIDSTALDSTAFSTTESFDRAAAKRLWLLEGAGDIHTKRPTYSNRWSVLVVRTYPCRTSCLFVRQNRLLLIATYGFYTASRMQPATAATITRPSLAKLYLTTRLVV